MKNPKFVGERYEGYKANAAYFGYPFCCFEYFLHRTGYKSRPELPCLYDTGFVPCDDCFAVLQSGEKKVEELIVNRQCPRPFGSASELKMKTQMN